MNYNFKNNSILQLKSWNTIKLVFVPLQGVLFLLSLSPPQGFKVQRGLHSPNILFLGSVFSKEVPTPKTKSVEQDNQENKA